MHAGCDGICDPRFKRAFTTGPALQGAFQMQRNSTSVNYGANTRTYGGPVVYQQPMHMTNLANNRRMNSSFPIPPPNWSNNLQANSQPIISTSMYEKSFSDAKAQPNNTQVS